MDGDKELVFSHPDQVGGNTWSLTYDTCHHHWRLQAVFPGFARFDILPLAFFNLARSCASHRVDTHYTEVSKVK